MDATRRPVTQGAHAVRFEWGAVGGAAIAHDAGVAVVVDVLSFSTAVDVALARGAAVIPYPSAGDAAETVAAQHGAALAGPRGSGLSLSPASLRSAEALPHRIVLPSPNGATACLALAAVTTVVAGSLRNASAVAARVARDHDVVAVVAAGERWPDGSLRPGVEDLWGAGAVLAALEDLDLALSPEAAVAADAYRLVEGRLGNHLAACTSGVELVGRGFGEDVEIAAEVDASHVVPRLGDGGFTESSR